MSAFRPTNDYEIDIDSFPLVIVTHWGALNDRQYAQYLADITEVPQRVRLRKQSAFGEKTVIIYDTTNATPPSAAQRKMQADWLKANEDTVRLTTLGIAFVAPTVMIRGVIQAVFWMQQPFYEYLICRELMEAYLWAEEKLEAAGLRAPPLSAIAAIAR